MEAALRKASEADGPALAQIESESFAHPHWNALDFGKYDTTVAEIEGKVIAFVVTYLTYLHADSDGKDCECEILNVAVSPGYRRSGLARLLLRSVMSKPGTYFLEVRESNASARALYAELGFREVGRRAHYYQTPDETAIVMSVKRC